MYQDNYYSRVTILQRSLSRSIRVCGKIRACTRFPANLFRRAKKLKTGESMPCQEVLLHLCKKENEMIIVSTVHNATIQDKLNRYVEKIKISSCTNEGNRYMREVTAQPVTSSITPFSEKH
jgi:hypothetical protein